jgi:hypothetical protein
MDKIPKIKISNISTGEELSGVAVDPGSDEEESMFDTLLPPNPLFPLFPPKTLLMALAIPSVVENPRPNMIATISTIIRIKAILLLFVS